MKETILERIVGLWLLGEDGDEFLSGGLWHHFLKTVGLGGF